MPHGLSQAEHDERVAAGRASGLARAADGLAGSSDAGAIAAVGYAGARAGRSAYRAFRNAPSGRAGLQIMGGGLRGVPGRLFANAVHMAGGRQPLRTATVMAAGAGARSLVGRLPLKLAATGAVVYGTARLLGSAWDSVTSGGSSAQQQQQVLGMPYSPNLQRAVDSGSDRVTKTLRAVAAILEKDDAVAAHQISDAQRAQRVEAGRRSGEARRAHAQSASSPVSEHFPTAPATLSAAEQRRHSAAEAHGVPVDQINSRGQLRQRAFTPRARGDTGGFRSYTPDEQAMLAQQNTDRMFQRGQDAGQNLSVTRTGNVRTGLGQFQRRKTGRVTTLAYRTLGESLAPGLGKPVADAAAAVHAVSHIEDPQTRYTVLGGMLGAPAGALLGSSAMRERLTGAQPMKLRPSPFAGNSASKLNRYGIRPTMKPRGALVRGVAPIASSIKRFLANATGNPKFGRRAVNLAAHASRRLLTGAGRVFINRPIMAAAMVPIGLEAGHLFGRGMAALDNRYFQHTNTVRRGVSQAG